MFVVLLIAALFDGVFFVYEKIKSMRYSNNGHMFDRCRVVGATL